MAQTAMEMEQTVYLIFNLFRMYATYYFMGIFIKPKEKKLFIFLAYVLFFLVNSFGYLWYHSYMVNIATNIIPLFLISCLYHAKLEQRIFVTCLIYGTGMFLDLVTVGFFYCFHIQSVICESGLATVILFYLTALVLRALFGEKYETASPVKKIYYFALFLIPVFSIVIGYITIQKWKNWNVQLTIVHIILFLLNIIVFYLFDQINKIYQKEQEIERMKQSKRYFRHELEIMEQAQLKLDCLRHDMKNHLYRIEILAKENNIEELLSYVEQGKEYLTVQNQYVTTGNKSLDCMMNFKLEEAKKKGIVFTTDMVLPDKLNINPFDLNTIIGNLLDNAIEAMDMTYEKKLDIAMKYNKNLLTVKIGNSCDEEIAQGLKTTKTNPSQHGFGLKSVQLIVNKYHGLLNQEIKGGYFLTKIVLYND